MPTIERHDCWGCGHVSVTHPIQCGSCGGTGHKGHKPEPMTVTTSAISGDPYIIIDGSGRNV